MKTPDTTDGSEPDVLDSALGSAHEKFKSITSKTTKISFIEKFIVRRAGADISLLEICSVSEKNRFLAMGGSMLGNTLLSICSSFYFFYTFSVNPNVPLNNTLITCSIISLVVGTMIYTMEYSIITSKDLTLKAIAFRLILSIVLGFAFAQPIETLVFRKSIEAELSQQSIRVRSKIDEDNKNFILDRKNYVDEVQKKVDELSTEKKNASDGMGNCGFDNVKCQIFTKRFKQVEPQYKLEETRLASAKESLKKAQKKADSDAKRIFDTESDDILSRLLALHNIVFQSITAFLFYLSIMLVLIIFDTLPLLIKISTKKSSYEDNEMSIEKMNAQERSDMEGYNKKILEMKYQVKSLKENVTYIMSSSKRRMQDMRKTLQSFDNSNEEFMKKISDEFDKLDSITNAKLKTAREKVLSSLLESYIKNYENIKDKFDKDIEKKDLS